MGPAQDTDRPYTARDLSEISDDRFRHELDRGKLVCDELPGIQHGAIVANLIYRLETWSRSAKTGHLTACGFRLCTDPDTVRAPDLAFISHDRLQIDSVTDYVEGAPELAIEVIAPHDLMVAMLDKVTEYFGAGVEQVWIVVPMNRTVMVHRSARDVTVLNDADTIIGDGILADLTLPVADIFD